MKLGERYLPDFDRESFEATPGQCRDKWVLAATGMAWIKWVALKLSTNERTILSLFFMHNR
jgi:hypothetical protein